MASYQRIALYILFDAIETDILSLIRTMKLSDGEELLSSDERKKALIRLQNQTEVQKILHPDADLLTGLDIGDKISVLNRHKKHLPNHIQQHFSTFNEALTRSIPVRNAVMHGRPLTTNDYATAFGLAENLFISSDIWPTLASTYKEFSERPENILTASFEFLEARELDTTLNNLPSRDYDDTGFVPRPKLETELKKKILGRHPVVTVLGDGGNGKTALTLQVLYGLVSSGEHDFDAIVWTSAKSNQLTISEIKRIEGAITDSVGIFASVADQFEPGDAPPLDRVKKLLEDNKILLVIDNLETVLDSTIKDFASEVPGESKILFTSRVPLGSDLSLEVGEFSPDEARNFLYRLRDAYQIERLRKVRSVEIDSYLSKLNRKPLLIKWFALGVASGLQPEAIVREPKMALRFCMENVVEKLSGEAKFVARVMSVVPSTISTAVLSHLVEIKAAAVERGLAELLRFALIEADDLSKDERKYFLKPFARSYIVKSMDLSQEETARYIARYRDSESAFQFERGGGIFDRYNPRTFLVRSRSEALVARRLRHTANLALRNKYELAENEIEQLRIVAPNYFEIFRTEAFIAYRMGDYPRAHAAYEVALEIEPNQPQLYFFFAGFLMRVYYDYEAAKTQFRKALALDPDSVEVLREAARNYFFLYEFENARKCIDRAVELASPKAKDQLILSDLDMQYYIRKAEHQESTGDPMGALQSLEGLKELIGNYDQKLVDQIMLNHLRKVLPVIDKLSTNAYAGDVRHLQELREQILELSPALGSANDNSSEQVDQQFRSGVMKQQGRTEAFGFLRDIWGQEVYVARNSVAADLWYDMINGQRVMFEVGALGSGKTFAKNITRL